jgi:SAM-dependent methyltransferase
MRSDHVRGLYDDEYAASYEEKFIHSERTRADAEHELEVLRELLAGARTWLDVACGTGYFLRHFAEVDRAGIDISPAMLERAKQANPGVPFLLHDFRDPLPTWEGRWDLVSCMWYAYGLVDTIDELETVIRNLWSFTSDEGTCFVPLADPRLMTGLPLPYRSDYDETSHLQFTAIVWSFVEEGGRKVHLNQLAPNIEYMVDQFEGLFASVEVIRYPPAFEGWTGRPALVARRKKPVA